MFGFFRRSKPQTEEAPPPAASKPAGSGLWSFLRGRSPAPAPAPTAAPDADGVESTRDGTATLEATPGPSPEPSAVHTQPAAETARRPTSAEGLPRHLQLPTDAARSPAEPGPREPRPAEPGPQEPRPAEPGPQEPRPAESGSARFAASLPAHAFAGTPDTAPEPGPGGDALAPATLEQSGGWLARLKRGLSKTRGQLAGFFGLVEIDEALLEELEAAMICADVGASASQALIADLRLRIKSSKLRDGESVRRCLRQILTERLRVLEGGIDLDRVTPLVIMIAGVNGAGKTTSIGKLARHVQREGKTVLLAAGDTFRAAAREQLAIWGQRNGVDVIAQQGGDPAAVAFDAVSAGKARGAGVVMIDTAGRLPTQTHLMEELRKIRKVIGKAMPDAPHESLLILDGNTGQNMLHQYKAFHEVAALTGLIVTKLDGTAKGGALLALAHQVRERPIPVYFIGIGEGLDDLQPFRAEEFASALLDEA